MSPRRPFAHAGARAVLVHIVTAAGAGCALLALLEAVAGNWADMFAWLGAALVIDAIDGPVARHLDVKNLAPRWSGATLDLIVDFLTYVFVPAYAIVSSGVLPRFAAVACGVSIVVAGALYFADGAMKMHDNFFRGFPALWNLVAFYLLLLAPPPAIAAGSVGVFLVLTFVPFPFIHPIRVVRWRGANLALLAIWSVLAVIALVHDMTPPVWVTSLLCLIAVYFGTVGLLRRV